MVNKRLLELAERQKNRNLPKKKKRLKKQSKLTQILERDENGKPKLTLNPLEKTVVHTPTQEEYNTLMKVYECGRWEWRDLPTQNDYWDRYKEKTCILVGNKFKYGDKKYHQERGFEIISTQEFYNAQNPSITSKMLKEINDWFDNHG